MKKYNNLSTHSDLQNGSRWRCRDRRACNATIVIDRRVSQVLRDAEHNHCPNWGEVKAKELLNEGAHEAAKNQNALPSEITQSLKIKADSEATRELPKSKSINN